MAKKKKEDPNTETVDCFRKVQEFFSETEMVEKAKAISAAHSEIENLKVEAKAEADKFKEAIKAKETEITMFCDQIGLGYEMVNRPVKMIRNFDKTVREYWMDGKVIETEPLTEEDYQHQIDFNDQSATKADEEEEEKED